MDDTRELAAGLDANNLGGKRFSHTTGFTYTIADQQGAMLLLHDAEHDHYLWVQRVRLDGKGNLTVAKVLTGAQFTLTPMR